MTVTTSDTTSETGSETGSDATAVFETLHAVPDIHLPITLTATEPISHGAGTAGNTQLLRTQDVVLADGRRTAVPYVSGNSLRHTLRAALAWHLARTIEIADGTLSKKVVDLLWSGGSLTQTGNQADLGASRAVHQILPALGMLGYSARSDIVAGTLWVDNVHLVCAENLWRLPESLTTHPHAGRPAGALRGEAFGTRHDVAGTPVDRYLELADTGTLIEMPAKPATTQMIYDMQVIEPGAVLWTGLHLHAPTSGHVAALAVAVDEAAPEAGARRIGLGGKRNTGFGVCLLDADLGVLGDVAAHRAAYERHLRGHAADIRDLLTRITG